MIRKNNPLSRQSNIVVQELENEILIYDLNNNKAFCLNETSSSVYQFCDGKNSVAEISDLVSIKLKTLISEDLIQLALKGFQMNNLLENGDEIGDHFAGLSRREVVKMFGLASMVALPFIASIVAPTSANAASVSCSCSSPGDCVVMTSCPSTVNCNVSVMLCVP